MLGFRPAHKVTDETVSEKVNDSNGIYNRECAGDNGIL